MNALVEHYFGSIGIVCVVILMFVIMLIWSVFAEKLSKLKTDLACTMNERDNWRRMVLEEDERANAAEKA